MTSGWFIPTVVKICQWFGFQDGFFFSFLTLWQYWNPLRRMTHLIAMAKMWRVAPGEFWDYGTGAYDAHVHLVSHHTCKDIEQYREGIDVRLSNVLVRKAAEIFSTCACLTLLLIWETQKWSDWLIWFPRSGKGCVKHPWYLMCQTMMSALVLVGVLVATDLLVIITGLCVFQRH